MALLGARFDDALVYAADAHREQLRKGGEIPYVAHLLAVASLVLEGGGDEDAAITALLHDVVEDQGGLRRLADVRARFGDVVADAVLECSAELKEEGSAGAIARSATSQRCRRRARSRCG